MLTNVKPAPTENKPCDKCLIHLLPPTDMGVHNCHEALVCKGILKLEKIPKKKGDSLKIKLDEFKPKEEVS